MASAPKKRGWSGKEKFAKNIEKAEEFSHEYAQCVFDFAKAEKEYEERVRAASKAYRFHLAQAANALNEERRKLFKRKTKLLEGFEDTAGSLKIKIGHLQRDVELKLIQYEDGEHEYVKDGDDNSGDDQEDEEGNRVVLAARDKDDAEKTDRRPGVEKVNEGPEDVCKQEGVCGIQDAEGRVTHYVSSWMPVDQNYNKNAVIGAVEQAVIVPQSYADGNVMLSTTKGDHSQVCLWVSGFSDKLSRDYYMTWFEENFGRAVSMHILIHPDQPKRGYMGTGFVQFAHPAILQECVNKFGGVGFAKGDDKRGFWHGGRKLAVDWSPWEFDLARLDGVTQSWVGPRISITGNATIMHSSEGYWKEAPILWKGYAWRA